ncbi:MAG: DUF2933 domain-containing protein [Nanoarchaeota archaeon]
MHCMKHNKWLIIGCLAVVGIAIFYFSSANWIWLILLLCPLMHLFMMKECLDYLRGKKGKKGKNGGKCH